MGSRMVVYGTDESNYAPDRHITRSQFAAILVRALGLEPGAGESKFSDVFAADWDCGYIDTAFSYGLITGYGNGSFGPDDEVTREQAMTMLVRAMRITGLAPRLSDGDIGLLLADYVDADAASDYARPSIAACLKAGLVVGVDGKAIAPTSSITRAEVAVIVQRLLRLSGLI